MSSKYKILYIDDEAPVRKLLSYILKGDEYTLYEAASGEEGLALASNYLPDVIILDLGLPDMEGKEVLRRIREWSKTPVIILTANKADDEKVMLLDMGEDDYLIKPFHGPELLARIRVAIRHAHKELEGPKFNQGGLEVDFAGRMVFVNGTEVKLTSKEYAFFKMLAQNAGRIVTQAALLKEIWGPNNEENTHYLRVYAAQLRKKIEAPLGRRIIATESGVGYRLLLN